MYTFTHTYGNNEIKFTVDVLGGEELYVNNKLVSHSHKWTLKNTHHFSIDGQPLTLQIKLNSLMSGECEVTIFEKDEVIFNQTRLFHFSTDGKDISFDEEQLRWKREIEFPNDILNMAWLFYFILMAASIAGTFIPGPTTEKAIAMTVLSVIAYSIYKLGFSIFKGLKPV